MFDFGWVAIPINLKGKEHWTLAGVCLPALVHIMPVNAPLFLHFLHPLHMIAASRCCITMDTMTHLHPTSHP
jgi:hypothetical protein